MKAAERAMKEQIILPENLAAWIDAAMPDLRGVRSVSIIRCSRLPFSWLMGPRYSGLTLWNRVYLREDEWTEPIGAHDLELLFHELVHVRQFRNNPLRFPLSYLWQLARVGYTDHPAEKEARSVASELLDRYRREHGGEFKT
jgi:hypothetical protein